MNSNNIGDYYEARVAPPGTDVKAFTIETNQNLTQLFNLVIAGSAGTEGQVLPPGTLVQPYPVNYSATGQLLGNINYGPNYAPCN